MHNNVALPWKALRLNVIPWRAFWRPKRKPKRKQIHQKPEMFAEVRV